MKMGKHVRFLDGILWGVGFDKGDKKVKNPKKVGDVRPLFGVCVLLLAIERRECALIRGAKKSNY